MAYMKEDEETIDILRDHVTYPNFNNILCLKKTLYFIFIVKFVNIDHVGSRMTVINYVEYFIN